MNTPQRKLTIYMIPVPGPGGGTRLSALGFGSDGTLWLDPAEMGIGPQHQPQLEKIAGGKYLVPNPVTGEAMINAQVALEASLPVWAALTEATFPGLKMLDQVPVAPGAFYVMDRGYLDFTRLIRLHRAGAHFVVRNKSHVRFQVVESRKVDKAQGLRCDQTVRLQSRWSKKHYAAALRRIRFRDAQHKRSFVFLTNNFELPARVICELYKRRWQVELFFKWIKQHLRLRRFFGRSPNAVYCQIWTAICTYLMVAIAKKELKLEKSLYQILQILSVSALEQLPLSQLLAKDKGSAKNDESQNTPCLLGF